MKQVREPYEKTACSFERIYFSRGSDNCTPLYLNQPVVYTPTILPTLNRFEIVTSGVDPLIGINNNWL